MECILSLGTWNHTPPLPKDLWVGCPLVPSGALSCRWLLWTFCAPRPRILFVNDLTGPGGMWAKVLYRTANATCHVTFVVNVCATAHLSNWVLCDCLDGPSKRDGPRWEKNTSAHLIGAFYLLGDKINLLASRRLLNIRTPGDWLGRRWYEFTF